MFDSNGRSVVTADCPYSTEPIDCYEVSKGNETIAKRSAIQADAMDSMQQAFIEAKSWLPFAAEQYNISANLKDYLTVPVIIMPSCLPNRNGVAFPFKELSKFNVEHGTIAYNTWRGKPTFADHVNSDPSAAKGVILSTAFRPIKTTNGRLWKVIALCAFDRSRDAMLANDILTRKRTEYSMGATVGGYSCNVCAASPTDGGCEHISLSNKKMQVWDTPRGRVLSYYNITDPIGFETSSVSRGAYSSAVAPNYMILD